MLQRTAMRAVLAGVLLTVVAAPAARADAAAGRELVARRDARVVRTTWTAEFGIERPSGLTYDPRRNELLVAEDDGTTASVLRLGFDEKPAGLLALPGVSDAGTLAFDAASNELTAVVDGDLVAVPGSAIESRRPSVRRRDVGDLGIHDTQSGTFDAATGTWYLLDARDRAVLRVHKRGAAVRRTTRVPLGGLGAGSLRGIAFNPEDGLLYVAIPEKELLYGLDGRGDVKKSYSLASVEVGALTAMTFAPSADRTDSATEHDLFIADAGTTTSTGGVTEVTLAAEPLAAATVTTQVATLVQRIDTSAFTPGSPDPSGIAWLPGPDRLEVVDSEVDEVTGAGYHGVNMWQVTRSGTVTDTGTLFPTYSKEPTGAAYDPASNTLFVSDDSKKGIHLIRPGADGRFGTGDDVVGFINAAALGSSDTEDPAFDTVDGVLYFSVAVSAEISRVDPVNGVFADGNDVVTHFDVGVHGVIDGEGLAFDAARNTLLVGDRTSRRIYEITKNNVLLRIIDARVAGLTWLSGLTVAPALDNPSRRDYWIVDRAVDNGPNPNENDGKIFEVSAPAGSVDTPPSVSITSPAEGATVTGATVSIQATASDDGGVTGVQFFDGDVSLGTDTSGADGWSIVWDTTTAADGVHTIRATATDTAGQTGTDTNDLTVDNSPPTVSISSPAPGATVSGVTPVAANAVDPQGIASVSFFVDGGTSIGTDSNGADGWSASWNTLAVADGAHQLTARATNRAGLSTTSAEVPVSVHNAGAPQVLDIPISSGADDIEERLSDGRINAASTDLDMMLDNSVVQSAVGLRFTGVLVPRGVTIVNAYVQFRSDETTSDPTNLVLNGVASDNAPAWTTQRSSLSTKQRTSASTTWVPPAWTRRQQTVDERTASIAAVVQEVVNRAGWSPGNALALVIAGSGRRVATAFEAGVAAPVLHIEYTTV